MKPSLVSSKPNRCLIFIGHSIVPLLLPRPPLPSTTLPTSTLPLRPRLPSTVPHLSCYCPALPVCFAHALPLHVGQHNCQRTA